MRAELRLWGALGLPLRVDGHEPLARALWDHEQGLRGCELQVTRDDGVEYAIRAADFFALRGAMAGIDERAIDESRGRVLDAGAAAGRLALALQSRGLDVVALDVSRCNVELMRRRGVAQPICGDVFALEPLDLGGFDTILFGMQSIGIAGSCFGLERMLISLRPHLRAGGQILADSSPPMDETGTGGAAELSVRFRYRNLRGAPFPWIYLSETRLREIAGGVGFDFELLARRGGGAREYLARLSPCAGAPRSPAPARRPG
jgi:SAM-dependent methyltransferase